MKWQWIENLKLKQKLFLVICPPLLGFLIFGSLSFIDKYQFKQNLTQVLTLSELAVINSDLVHELQKERGMSAGFLGSKGQSFRDKLPQQRSAVDIELNKFRSFIADKHYSDDLGSSINSVTGLIGRLTAIRGQIDGLSISVAEEVKFYSQLNAELLSIVDLTAQLGANQQIAMKAAAFGAYLQMKERAGIERAVLASTFGQQGFKPGMFTRFVTLVSEQNSYQERFQALADDTLKLDLANLLQLQAFNDVASLRQLAMGQDSQQIASQSPEAWFAKSTARIEQLRKFEKQIAEDLIEQTQVRLAEANNQMLILSLGLVLMLLVVSVLTISVTRFLNRSVRHIYQSVTQARAEFDLSVRIDQKSQDEFGELARAFNDMMADFERVILQVRSSASTLLSAVEQMETHSTSMQADVTQGHSEADQVASAMTQMSATVSQIASNAVQASEASADANKEARAGNRDVEKTSEAIAVLAQDIESAGQAINQLDQDIHSIVDILEVISGIAEQTNLLALNAAIEAARAGEMGRGFAVVADEVRSLAQRAQTSTQDIKLMTDKLREGAKVAVSAMDRGQAQAKVSVEEVQHAGSELIRIVEHVDMIDSLNQQVAAATHQQSAVAEEVNRNAMQISDIYQNTQEIADRLGEINEALLKDATSMSDEVSKFKVTRG